MMNQYTCLDGFAYNKQNVRDAIEKSFVKISLYTSNLLAMLKMLLGMKGRLSRSPTAEVFPWYGRIRERFLAWLSPKNGEIV